MAKVLLVEDDNNLREIYQARLQAEGYDIVSASDGEEALVVAKQEKPDLVISDVMMPKISGFEMLDILRNTDGLKDVKVIMLTALGQSDDQQRADKLGADRYLVKSQVTLEDIVKVAHNLLEGGDQATPAAAASTTPADPVATPSAPEPDSPAPLAADPVTPPPADPAAPPAEPVTPAADPEPATVPASSSAAPFTPVEVPHEAPAESAEQAVTANADVNAAASAVASDNPETTAQEEAEVEAKIEDFVTGASTEATTPTEIPAETTASESTPEPNADTATAAETQAHDDKVMADAVQSLSTTPESPVAADPTATALPDPVEAAPVIDQPSTAAAPPPSDAAPVTPAAEAPANDAVTVAHKKIIQPLDSTPKTDITTLVAAEEAKEATPTPPAAPVIVSSDQPAAPEAPEAPADPSKPNPNDIAL